MAESDSQPSSQQSSQDLQQNSQDSSECSKCPDWSENQAYESQFFGFTPRSFSNGLFNAIFSLTWEGLNQIENHIDNELGGQISKDEIRQATQNVMSKINKSINKSFDKFESYILTNIFCIPSDVILDEDEAQLNQYSEEDVTKIEKTIEMLNTEILETSYKNSELRKHLAKLDGLKRAYQSALNQLNNSKVKECAALLSSKSGELNRLSSILEATLNQ